MENVVIWLISNIDYILLALVVISIISFIISMIQKSILAVFICGILIVISGMLFGTATVAKQYIPTVENYINIAEEYLPKLETFEIPSEEEIINSILEDYTFKLNPDGTLTLEEK